MRSVKTIPLPWSDIKAQRAAHAQEQAITIEGVGVLGFEHLFGSFYRFLQVRIRGYRVCAKKRSPIRLVFACFYFGINRVMAPRFYVISVYTCACIRIRSIVRFCVSMILYPIVCISCVVVC